MIKTMTEKDKKVITITITDYKLEDGRMMTDIALKSDDLGKHEIIGALEIMLRKVKKS